MVNYEMDAWSLLIGLGAGFIVGALVFTPSGRSVARAGASRTARYLSK